MRATVLAVLLTAMSLPAAAADAQPYSIEQMRSRAAHPLVFLGPVYPAEALRSGIEGQVDVQGTIREDGSFDVTSIDAAPDRADFKEAVRVVLHRWRLRPSYAPDCRPHAVEGTLRVWFEIKQGRGVVSVARPAAADPQAVSPGGPQYKALSRVEPEYPMSGRRYGFGGTIEAYMKVGRDGEVQEVAIDPTGLPADFGRATRAALMQWRYPAYEGERCIGFTVVYLLR